ncbi:MAG: hypothetical protein CMN56_05290 [Sneathiella sp.]|uniref:type II toxin-antitoxin system PemK/MazF family toxin n=1 Tax=Sneathiella sp. TaxID=1964365 RepID=UPI000C54F647|nr:type II toxin-antitoxin system PemK/MazF family toxin [Sneathiella sp.]MAZ02534.1 hypothetical protein [Sneathiella sp.]|tara:strand:- start:487 stop:891 length:405 start_codon:yes stop_codon:yes gene_type:complete
MALHIHPAQGTIVICDFNRSFIPPEMVKRRPVVVISPRFRERADLCTVVPLSTSIPDPIMPYHCELDIGTPLPEPFIETRMWVKADLVVTVALQRLIMPFLGKEPSGKRIYDTRIITPDDLARIQNCVRHALGI